MSNPNLTVDVSDVVADTSADESARRWASVVTATTPPRKIIASSAATTSKKAKKQPPPPPPPPPPPDKAKRQTIAPTNQDAISKKLGYVVEEFKCSHNNFQGILYSGPLGLVFLGRILLFEWTVVLKWDDVVKVSKRHPPTGNAGRGNKAKQQQDPMNDCIRIETRGENAKMYDFERFFDASKALSILVSLHSDSILDLTDKVIPTPRVLSRGMRRMNSDPLMISNLFNFDDLPLGVEQDGVVAAELGGHTAMRRNRSSDDSTMNVSRRVGDELGNMDIGDGPAPPAYGRATTYDFSGHNLFNGAPFLGNTADDVATGNAAPSTNIPLASDCSSARMTNGVDLTKEWLQVFGDVAEYKEQVIRDREIKCSLDQFVETFVRDNATHSIVQFMDEIGELDIHVSAWVDDADGLAKRRTIEYTHPVDVPMAPPTARARKEQSYRQYGEHGLIFETKTFVSDVPMTDCFYVADVMRVESRDGGKKVSLNVDFDIRFVKSTIFQSLITRTTKGEFEKFILTMANFMAKNLGDDEAAAAPIAVPAPVPARTPRANSPAATSGPWYELSTVLIVLVLLMQGWILMDIRSVKLELRQMAAVIADNRQQVCISDSVPEGLSSGEFMVMP